MKKITIKAEAETIERLILILQIIAIDIETGTKRRDYAGSKLEYEFKIEDNG